MTGSAPHTCHEKNMTAVSRSGKTFVESNDEETQNSDLFSTCRFAFGSINLLDSFRCVSSIQSSTIPHCGKLTLQAPADRQQRQCITVIVLGVRRYECHWVTCHNTCMTALVKCVINSDCLRREVVEIATVQLDRAFFILKQ